MKYLIPLLFPLTLFAESQTTGNLITNGTFENGNANGWTQIGNGTVISDCCGSSYDYEFGNSGSIEQSFDLTSETITQPMLNNGVTLNSSVLMQNGECAVAGCWGGSGPADTFTIRLQIKDINDNVLSVTTQERTNVTGINGKDFTDSVSFTGTGSNGGNILISGSDGNSPANLGGPNVDNISVTMTYDDTVLSATESAIIATAFEEIEEVLSTEIETVEFIPIEEFVFEVFEEPEITFEMIEEITFEEIAIEEINTGIVEIFTIAIEEEIIPMEVAYEEPATIEEIAAEIQIEEEFVETRETGPTIEETVEYSGEVEPEPTREEVVEGEPAEESVAEVSETESEESTLETSEVSNESETVSNGSNTEDTVIAEEEVTDETIGEGETTDSESGDGGTEVADSEETLESGTETVAESRNERSPRVSTRTISIEDIEKKVSETVKRIDQRLIATSMIVAKAMQNNNILDTYDSINQDIFNNQPIINGGDYYETRNYADNRVLYAENQDVYNDVVFRNQKQIEEADDALIRAQEELRRIKDGF